MKDLPITEARQKLTALPDQLRRTHETVAVTRRGKPVLAILPWEEYEAVLETLDVMTDERLMATLRQSIREIQQGGAILWESAKRNLSR